MRKERKRSIFKKVLWSMGDGNGRRYFNYRDKQFISDS